METFSALLALCEGKSPVTGEIPSQRPVARSFDVFFDLRLKVNTRKAGDLKRHRAFYDVIVISFRCNFIVSCSNSKLNSKVRRVASLTLQWRHMSATASQTIGNSNACSTICSIWLTSIKFKVCVLWGESTGGFPHRVGSLSALLAFWLEKLSFMILVEINLLLTPGSNKDFLYIWK